MLYSFALTPVSCLLITMAKFVISLEPRYPIIYRLWNKLWFLLPVRLHVQLRYDTKLKRRKDLRHVNRIIQSPGLIVTLIRTDSLFH